jgi:hypothetical protein
MDSEEYTPLWIPMGWPLNLNEPALSILRADYRVQEEPECTKRGIYFGQLAMGLGRAENDIFIKGDTYYESKLTGNLYGKATVNDV